MKQHYDPETDSLSIELSAAPGAETREIADGFLGDLDADGIIVGFDTDSASKKSTPPRSKPSRLRPRTPLSDLDTCA